jgi:hypothetical protein
VQERSVIEEKVQLAIKPDEASFHLIKVINWSLVCQNAHLICFGVKSEVSLKEK